MGVDLHTRLDIEHAILYTLAYFDVFRYPLTVEEIFHFSPLSFHQFEIQESLHALVAQGKVFSQENMYGLRDESLAFEQRQSDNILADKMIPVGVQFGELILKFPFIKGVCISGSLSKNVFKADDDIDFFIITQKNRIWISRLLLKCYKFFWLKNSRAFFCINYFISEDDLQIKEENLFTAIELITLLPLMEKSLFEALQQKNPWVASYLPHAKWNKIVHVPVAKSTSVRLFERIFKGSFGTAIDMLVMKAIHMRNRLKYRKFAKSLEFKHMFKATRTESKIHPLNMSKTVQRRHQAKLEQLEIDAI